MKIEGKESNTLQEIVFPSEHLALFLNGDFYQTHPDRPFPFDMTTSGLLVFICSSSDMYTSLQGHRSSYSCDFTSQQSAIISEQDVHFNKRVLCLLKLFMRGTQTHTQPGWSHYRARLCFQIHLLWLELQRAESDVPGGWVQSLEAPDTAWPQGTACTCPLSPLLGQTPRESNYKSDTVTFLGSKPVFNVNLSSRGLFLQKVPANSTCLGIGLMQKANFMHLVIRILLLPLLVLNAAEGSLRTQDSAASFAFTLFNLKLEKDHETQETRRSPHITKNPGESNWR